ncbi:MAG: anaerobic ribonucleoside-triphosphate reductase activating protein [bacterium]
MLKFSALDYPGHLSAVVFTQGCNWRCPFCHNPELIPLNCSNSISNEQIFNFLKTRLGLLEGVCITGGEPTIQNGLIDFIQEVKQLGYKVKLDTNGSHQDAVEKIIYQARPDMLAMDIKTSWSGYCKATGVKLKQNFFDRFKQLVEFTEDNDVDLELRTTVVPGLVDKEDIKKIGEWLGGTRKYVLQQFRPEVTYNPNFIGLSPYSSEQVKEMAKLAQQFFNRVILRGVD